MWSKTKRPLSFDALFGCEAIKNYFKNLSNNGKDYPHAILLQGQYGSGKTTTAKLIAMNLQCKNKDENGMACKECKECKDIIEDKYALDVKQLDGGQIGKDDVIDTINEFITFSSLRGNKKILIIEEFQELSQKAKNSMLRILELNRENHYFIFTSMQDLPQSGITSRCKVFKFKQADVMETMYYLKSVLESENLWNSEKLSQDFKTKGLLAIAENSNGSLRDAVQKLEQVIDSNCFTEESIRDELGIIGVSSFYKLLEDLLENRNYSDIVDTFFKGDETQIFNLAYKVISDVVCYKAFKSVPGGSSYFEDQAAKLSSHIHIDLLIDTFKKLSLASKPYLKKSDFIIYLSELSLKIKKENSLKKIPIRGSIRQSPGDLN